MTRADSVRVAGGGVVALAAAMAAALSCLACNELGLGSPGSGGSSASATAQAVVGPSPQVTLLSPARASFLAVGPVAVQGTATSALGSTEPIAHVRINGDPAVLAPDGSFQAFINLVPGVNVIEVVATDAAGKTGTRSQAVIAGDWKPLAEPIRDAMQVRLEERALPALESVLENVLFGLDLNTLFSAPITDEPVLVGPLQLFHAFVRIFNARFRDVHVALDLRPDGLHIYGEIFDPFIEVEASAAPLVATPEVAQAWALRGVIEGRIQLFVHPDDRLGLRIVDEKVQFHGFDAAFGPGSLLQSLLPVLRPLIREGLEELLEGELRELNLTMQTGLDSSLTPQVPYDVLGKPFAVDARGEWVLHDDTSLGFGLRFDAPPQQALTARGQAAPGSWTTAGGPPIATTQRGAVVSLDDDMLNRLLHSAWAQGLLDHDLTQQLMQSQSITLGNGGLTAGDLAQFLPEIVGHVPPGSPLGVKIEAGLPPIFKVTGAPDLLRIEMGEVYIDMLVDRGNGMETLFKVALHIGVGATAALDQSSGIKLSSARNADIGLDLIAEPIVRLDRRRIQVVLQTALTPLIPRLINKFTVIPIPHVQQLTLFDLQAFPDGPESEHLTIGVDLIR